MCFHLTSFQKDCRRNMSAELANTHAAQNGLQGDANAADKNVEIWKIKKLIRSLEAARGYIIHQY